MAGAKAIWAIDIGQCALKALHARLSGDVIEVDNFITIEHEQILSQPDADEPALIRGTLKKLVSKADLGRDPIILSVPGHRSFARFSKLPPVEPKKIPAIVDYEAKQQIPFGIDEVVWDYQVFRASDGPDIEVGIFAIKQSLIAQYLDYFRELNLTPIVVQTAPVALYNACLFEGMMGSDAVIIADVGAQNTNFLIAEGHRLWLRNIPIGGNNFTESLQKSFKLNFTKAEQLKRTAATSKYARAVFQSMRPVFSDLSAEFQRSVGFYTSVNREAEVQKVYALGNAFRLPGLLKFLQQNVGMPVERVETFGKLKLAGGLNEVEFNENLLSFGVAYGLAVQGLGQAKVETDLMPPEVAKEAVWRGKKYWFGAAAACLVLAAGVVWLKGAGDSSKIASDRQEHEPRIKQVVDKYDRYLREYKQLTGGGPEKAGLAEYVAKLRSMQYIHPRIMAMVTEAASKTGLDSALAEASTPEAYAEAVKGVPRGERRQIFIDTVTPVFVPNATPEQIRKMTQAVTPVALKVTGRSSSQATGAYEMPNMGGPGMPGGAGYGMPPQGMGPPGEYGGGPYGPGGGAPEGYVPGRAPGGGVPDRAGGGMARQSRPQMGEAVDEELPKGFLVTISGTTPYSDPASRQKAARFLAETLVKNLQSYGKDYGREHGLWIEPVEIKNVKEVNPADKGVSIGGQDPGRVRDRRTTNRATEEAERGPFDPITGESMADDCQFTVVCFVHLGEPKEESAEPDGAAGQPARRPRS